MAPLTFEQSMAQHLAEQQKQRQEQKAQFDKAQAELKEQRLELNRQIQELSKKTDGASQRQVNELKELRKKNTQEALKGREQQAIIEAGETDKFKARKQSIEEQKIALGRVRESIEASGGVAAENKKFQREELRIAREEFALRKQQATASGAKEEIAKEERAMIMKQGTLLQKISAGIGGIGANMKEKAKAVGGGLMKILKGTLFAGLFMALAAFFQSGAYQKTIDFIFDTLIPGIAYFFEKFVKPVGEFFYNVGARFFQAFENIQRDFETVFDSDKSLMERLGALVGIFKEGGIISLGILGIVALFAPFKVLALGKIVGKGLLFTIGKLLSVFKDGGAIEAASKQLIKKSGGGKKGLFTNMMKGKGGIFKALGKFTGLFAAGGLIAGAMNFFTDKAKTDVDKAKKNVGVDADPNKTKTVTPEDKPQPDKTKQPQPEPEVKKQPPLKTDAVPTKPAVQTTAAKAAQATAEQSSKQVGKQVAKAGIKSALKKIPIAGALFGLAFGAQRALAGDFSGAAMEVASGLAGAIPIIGTAASLGIDAALMAKDLGAFNKVQNKIEDEIGGREDKIEKLQQQLAEGGLRPSIKRMKRRQIEKLEDEINALRNEKIQNAALREKSGQQGQVVIDAKSDNSQKVDSTTQQVNNQMIGNPDPIVAAAVA